MSGDSEQKKEDWMNTKWRPAMGWLYMFVCFFDFVLAPVLWSILQAKDHGTVTSQWQPLTLQGAGLFHLAMGAVLGIAAYGRTQEKLNGAENGGINASPPGIPTSFGGGFGPGAGTTYVPTPAPAPVFSPAPTPAPIPTPAPTSAPGAVTTGFGGKPAPVQPANPVQ